MNVSTAKFEGQDNLPQSAKKTEEPKSCCPKKSAVPEESGLSRGRKLDRTKNLKNDEKKITTQVVFETIFPRVGVAAALNHAEESTQIASLNSSKLSIMRNLNKISKDKRDGLGTKEETLAVRKVKNLLEKLDQEGNERCNRRG